MTPAKKTKQAAQGVTRKRKRAIKQKAFYNTKKVKPLEFSQAPQAAAKEGFSIRRSVPVLNGPSTSTPQCPVWEGGFVPRK